MPERAQQILYNTVLEKPESVITPNLAHYLKSLIQVVPTDTLVGDLWLSVTGNKESVRARREGYQVGLREWAVSLETGISSEEKKELMAALGNFIRRNFDRMDTLSIDDLYELSLEDFCVPQNGPARGALLEEIFSKKKE